MAAGTASPGKIRSLWARMILTGSTEMVMESAANKEVRMKLPAATFRTGTSLLWGGWTLIDSTGIMTGSDARVVKE
jgi:hypothetical protein